MCGLWRPKQASSASQLSPECASQCGKSPQPHHLLLHGSICTTRPFHPNYIISQNKPKKWVSLVRLWPRCGHQTKDSTSFCYTVSISLNSIIQDPSSYYEQCWRFWIGLSSGPSVHPWLKRLKAQRRRQPLQYNGESYFQCNFSKRWIFTNCPGIKLPKFAHFCSRHAMPVWLVVSNLDDIPLKLPNYHQSSRKLNNNFFKGLY